MCTRSIKWDWRHCLTALVVAGLLAGQIALAHAPALYAAAVQRAVDYPPDPRNDVPWPFGVASLSDMIAAFNTARSAENSQLGTFLPPMVAPSAATWNAMSEAERALWLINQERTVRKLPPLHSLETNVTGVAQNYAVWLLANNQFDHEADGKDPWLRLDAVPAIKACHDFLGVAENLWWAGTTDPAGISMPVERAVYGWLYDDASSGWGHRHAILWTPYTENSGPGDREGFLGIGHARGAFRPPGARLTYSYSDVVVMNIFDPCASWAYAAPPVVPTPAPPKPAPTATPPPQTRKVSGVVSLPRWETITEQPFERTTWPGAWQVSDANGATDGDYEWVAASCRVHSGEFSGMAVGGGTDGMPKGCADPYPNNARSWMIFGPFSLADAIAAEMKASVWVHTEEYNDELCLVARADPNPEWNGVCISGTSGDWVDEVLDLNRVYKVGSLLGRPKVYVALVFISNASVTLEHQGAYADNVVVRKAVAKPAAAADTVAAETAALSGMAGVLITDDAGHATVTDSSGAFTLAGLPAQRVTLTASQDGYQFYPPSVTVDLTQGDVSGATFVGTSSILSRVYLPALRRPRTGVQSAEATALEDTVATPSPFAQECTPAGCSLFRAGE